MFSKPISTFWALTLVFSVAMLLLDFTWLQNKLLQYDFDTKYNISYLTEFGNPTVMQFDQSLGDWISKAGKCVEPELSVDFDYLLKNYNLSTYADSYPMGKGVIRRTYIHYLEGEQASVFRILYLSHDRFIWEDQNPSAEHPVCIYERKASI